MWNEQSTYTERPVPTGTRKNLPSERLHDMFAIMDELKKAMCAMPDKDELRVCN